MSDEKKVTREMLPESLCSKVKIIRYANDGSILKEQEYISIKDVYEYFLVDVQKQNTSEQV